MTSACASASAVEVLYARIRPGIQARDSELDAAEIPHDHHEDVAQAHRVDLAEDRAAGRAGGLAVVIGPEAVPLVAQAIGVAVVPRVVVFLLETGHDVLHFLLRFHGIGQRDEAGAVVLEQPLAPGRDAPVCVEIFHHDESSFF